MHNCPICDAPTALCFTISAIPVRRCNHCGHAFADYHADEQHLETVYDDNYFSSIGPGYHDYLSEAELLRSHGLRYGSLLSRYAPNGRVLDVGSAAGFIAGGMRDAGLTVTLLEPNARMVSYASDSLHLPARNVPLEHLEVDAPYDAIAMIQVVMHFFDPRLAFAAAAHATRPGGYWLIESWKANSVVARALGRRWHGYNPPSVLHYFTTTSLDALAADFGFVRIATGRPLKLITAAHASALCKFLSHRSRVMRFAAHVADRLPHSLSLPYLGDDIFWAIYQQKDEPGSKPRLSGGFVREGVLLDGSDESNRHATSTFSR